jgi:adenylate cyclase
MNPAALAELSDWLVRAALDGRSEPDLLDGFCSRALAAGIPLAEVNVIIDTLHPIYEGRVFRWRRDRSDLPAVFEYGRTEKNGSIDANWRQSPFFHLIQTGETYLRRRLGPENEAEFPVHGELAERGQTDYLALIHRFAAEGIIGEMDCIYSSWSTDAEGGFPTEALQAMKRLIPTLAVAMKCASLARITRTLVETYLGRNTGSRVLAGNIARGVTEKITAVLWFSDLRSFTRITETTEAAAVIPFLNAYSDAVISSIHEAGGEVLKLIGDGTLAIFDAADAERGCAMALAAEKALRARLPALEAEHLETGLPVTTPYIGLHIGEVFYGNVGSEDRLDFTVVGPAVNEAARVAAMCRSAERDLLMSAAFCEAASAVDRRRFVSVGRYALRGVERSQELFTVDTGL